MGSSKGSHGTASWPQSLYAPRDRMFVTCQQSGCDSLDNLVATIVSVVLSPLSPRMVARQAVQIWQRRLRRRGRLPHSQSMMTLSVFVVNVGGILRLQRFRACLLELSIQCGHLRAPHGLYQLRREAAVESTAPRAARLHIPCTAVIHDCRARRQQGQNYSEERTLSRLSPGSRRIFQLRSFWKPNNV